MYRKISVLLLPILVSGCASTLSGLDGETSFSCKAPDGVMCSSLSGVYANALENNLPSLQTGKNNVQTVQINNGESLKTVSSQAIVGRALDSGAPIRSQPKTLRVWVAPWEDDDGDLHDQSYIYVVVDTGRWLVEHHRHKAVDRYLPTFIKAAPLNQPGANKPGNVAVPQNVITSEHGNSAGANLQQATEQE